MTKRSPANERSFRPDSPLYPDQRNRQKRRALEQQLQFHLNRRVSF